MTVKVSKPAINVRAELADLKKPTGIAGEAMLRAETPQEQQALIGMGRRNIIINGAMNFDQRNSGSAVTPTTDQTYTLDRFSARLSAASKYSVQQVADGPSGYKYSLKVTSAAATTVGTNDYYQINTPIEAFDTNQLRLGSTDAKHITLSFWVKSSLTGTFGGGYSNNQGDRFYAWEYSIDTANTWEHKSITIEGPQDGTWQTTSLTGLWVYWTLAAGSGQQSNAGFWGTTFKRGPTGGTNIVATSGATWQITGVQLEAGDTATPFEHRSYGEELALCQRYFQHVYTDCSVAAAGRGASGGDATVNAFPVPVALRASPTVTHTGSVYLFDSNSRTNGTPNSVTVSNYPTNGSIITLFYAFSGVVCDDDRVNVISTYSNNNTLTLDAEL